MSYDHPPKPFGTDAASRFMAWVWEQITGPLKLIDGPGYKVNRTTRGTGLILTLTTSTGASSTASSPIRPFTFVQSWGDYIIGKDVIYGTLTPIAKPFKHRNSNGAEWDNGVGWTLTYPQNVQTGSPPVWNSLAFVSRTKSNFNYTEYQRITPGWTAQATTPIPTTADTFYAIQLTQGGTGIRTDPLDKSFPAGTPVVWLDLNLDGRAWAATPDGNP